MPLTNKCNSKLNILRHLSKKSKTTQAQITLHLQTIQLQQMILLLQIIQLNHHQILILLQMLMIQVIQILHLIQMIPKKKKKHNRPHQTLEQIVVHKNKVEEVVLLSISLAMGESQRLNRGNNHFLSRRKKKKMLNHLNLFNY